MPWVVNSTDGQQSYPALAGETLYIIAGDAGLSAVRATPVDPALVLGTLAVQSYGAKLEAGLEDLKILPPVPTRFQRKRSGTPPAEAFLLRAKSDDRVETTIVRNQDKITSQNTSGTLTLIWTAPQIQVQSSEKKENLSESGEAAQAENETEDDDEDLNNTTVSGVSKSQTMRSTPYMSASRSEIIQETPTVDRIGPSRTEPPVLSNAPQEQSIVNDLTKPEDPTDAETEDNEEEPKTSETVLRKSSRQPKVEIPKSSKRPSLALEEESSSPITHLTKRRKVDKDSNGSSTPVQTARKTAIKSKKRESAMKAASTPSRSQRSTQSSIAGSPVDVEDDYNGPKPRVALSNSTIQPNSSFVKFLKKTGGNIVDSVEVDCNILCIKEGPILKTPKLLQAVASGHPIVTDKWLIDSTKAARFLPLELYKPPDLEPVWKIPQSRLFESYTIFFTPALKAQYKTSFADIDKLCKAVGARRVVSKKPGGKDLYEKASIVFLAEAEGDKDVPALLEAGHTCYTKDFLTHSIVGGEVDLASEEFKVQPEEAKPEKRAKKNGRGRNS
ncbi:uncharacterized protein N0V89_007036 [Didymosphaeria variabile]|uniref:BRCT domain-containing protein n=1 Tax=Didymosphaeria variabile TaxID=1932322 RepID=A0A9W8XKA5_9PLEO|nr:uncharacterized protein N0V89_007036 [Didymosphaeria variabile]KAJ4351693.1 hypothetical protein N0V89_007036 [Didymosphaeria variabile]